MIILRNKTFSRPKGKEETDHQKKDRRKLAGSIVSLGTGAGIISGQVASESKVDKILTKGTKMTEKVAREANRDMEAGSRWASNAMKHAKNPKEVLNYATKKIEERGVKARKDIDRISKITSKSAGKAILKSIGKGAAIGTAIATPLALAANKKIKKNNEKINAKRRGIKD